MVRSTIVSVQYAGKDRMTDRPQLPGHGIKVIIADDMYNIVSVLSSVLELRGFAVITADNGRKALDLIEKEHPQVALLDIVMPGSLDGLTLCERIKSRPDLADTLVIMITSITQGSDIPDGLWRKGTRADDFVTKPFDPFDLADRIERLCVARGLTSGPEKPA